jgi:hypothetical protein
MTPPDWRMGSFRGWRGRQFPMHSMVQGMHDRSTLCVFMASGRLSTESVAAMVAAHEIELSLAPSCRAVGDGGEYRPDGGAGTECAEGTARLCISTATLSLSRRTSHRAGSVDSTSAAWPTGRTSGRGLSRCAVRRRNSPPLGSGPCSRASKGMTTRLHRCLLKPLRFSDTGTDENGTIPSDPESRRVCR